MDPINICLYGAASDTIDRNYIREGEALGRAIASKGHTLIFGAGGRGMMGACARGMESLGGKIIGVMPYFMDEYEGIYRKCTELIMTDTMSERKSIMEERSDAFVIAPGGIGTMDEFFQIITLKDLNQKDAPIILFNINGYYNSIVDFLETGIEAGFINPSLRNQYCVKTTAEGVVSAIESAFKK